LGADFFDPASHIQDRLARTPTGYAFLDKCLDGGWWKGSLICFLSGPKSGKSTWLGNMAAKSVENGYNTAYITLELQKEIVSMRIGSNMLSIPMDEYREQAKDRDYMKKRLSSLRESSFKPMGQFHIQEFPSSTFGTTDLRAYLKKAEETLGYKFENIFLDYLNIMKNWRNPNTENLYMKIKQISEDLRAIAMEEQWAIITATQTNRCISTDSIVYEKEKGKIEIKNLKINDYVLGDEGYVKVKNIHNNEKTKTYKIKTKRGKEIICSRNHVFPVNNSFQQVSNMKIGDKIYIKK
jgi:replicative DNA helicase